MTSNNPLTAAPSSKRKHGNTGTADRLTAPEGQKVKRQRSTDRNTEPEPVANPTVIPQTAEDPSMADTSIAADSSFGDETEGNAFVIPSYHYDSSSPAFISDDKWSCRVPEDGWPDVVYDKWTDMYRKHE